MSVNGANFVFRSSGMHSPLGNSMPSGSYAGNRAMWAPGMGGGGSTFISVKNSYYGGGGYDYGGYGMYGMDPFACNYAYGCCGGGGTTFSEKDAYTAMAVGAGIGLLASPLGMPILKGIGWCGKQVWNGAKWAATKVIAPAATWTFNNVLKPVGKAALWGCQQVGNAICNVGKGLFNWIRGKSWNYNNEWDKLGANNTFK